jgi:hypothetical protein
MGSVLLDAAGHRRSLATMPGYHRGRPPRNKGELYPADPPTVEAATAARWGWTAGRGSSPTRGWRSVASSRSARCCA